MRKLNRCLTAGIAVASIVAVWAFSPLHTREGYSAVSFTLYSLWFAAFAFAMALPVSALVVAVAALLALSRLRYGATAGILLAGGYWVAIVAASSAFTLPR